MRVFAYNIYMFPAFMVALKMCAYVDVSTLVHMVAGKKLYIHLYIIEYGPYVCYYCVFVFVSGEAMY